MFILMAIFTTSGTFMLLFIAALQNIGEETEEAGMMDGANAWQVFDQIAIGSQGAPAKTTLTPAYLSFTKAFNDGEWGRGAAIAFVLFAIIIVMTILQRLVLGSSDFSAMTRRQRRADRAARQAADAREAARTRALTHANTNNGGVA
ncbi:hypothetical protein GCM10027030_10950 [Luteococcus sediminum]